MEQGVHFQNSLSLQDVFAQFGSFEVLFSLIEMLYQSPADLSESIQL